jgi:hypothetical protein
MRNEECTSFKRCRHGELVEDCVRLCEDCGHGCASHGYDLCSVKDCDCDQWSDWPSSDHLSDDNVWPSVANLSDEALHSLENREGAAHARRMERFEVK